MAHILVVDDDKDILRLMQVVLQKAGHHVTLAISGPEGLEAVKEGLPNLIIADVMMPEMTGYDFTRRVRSMPNAGDLPIVIFSARFQPVDKQAAIDAGATDYMPKTLPPPEIISRIRELLGEDETPPGGDRPGVTLAFFSLRGGVGVTTLAVNVAVTLALSKRTPVGLTDLNPIAGHAGLMLNLRPQRHIYNILQSDQPLSETVIKQQLTAHSSGVQLLASPLISPNTPGNHKIEAVIKHFSAVFTFNLIDMPHTVNATTYNLLPAITRLVMILAPDVPSLQSAAVGLQLLTQRGLKPEQIVPVLNRNTPAPGLATNIIQKTLRRPLAAEIPYEINALAAINSGKPLVLHSPKSAAATAIARLAVSLMK
ncbi:MAG: response regulator [Anaerolineae bacterium]